MVGVSYRDRGKYGEAPKHRIPSTGFVKCEWLHSPDLWYAAVAFGSDGAKRNTMDEGVDFAGDGEAGGRQRAGNFRYRRGPSCWRESIQ